ncbi:AAA family ATPase [Haliangium sp.]|uniref:AAA family ATPase n=1 Tax=Haliangium sp. TaxID=2663208 RepID=UPI003D0A0963
MTMDPAATLPEDALAPHVRLVRLYAEGALLRRFNAGYGFADTRIPAELYLWDDAARERMSRDSLRPQDTHLAQAQELEQALSEAYDAVLEQPSPLAALGDRFGLDAAERALLTIAAAYEIDRDVRELCHSLAGRRAPALYADTCLELAPELASTGALLAALHPSGALRQGCLLDVIPSPGEPDGRMGSGRLGSAIAIARAPLDWLLGDDRIAAPLDATVRIIGANENLHVYLDTAIRGQIERVAHHIRRVEELRDERAVHELPLVLIQGPKGSGKRAVAHLLAAMLGRPLLLASLPDLTATTQRVRDPNLPKRVLAQARLRGAVAYLPGIDAIDDDQDQGAQSALTSLASGELPARALTLEAISRHPGLIILASNEQGLPALPVLRPFHLIRIPPATLSARQRAWERGMASLADLCAPNAEAGLESEAEDLAARYVVGPGAIGHVVREVRSFAVATEEPIQRSHIEDALGRRMRLRLGPFGTRITRRARLEEMVLPPDVQESIQHLIAMVRERSQILERWGYARHLGLHRGVSGLFSGEPGTGKTMAASVVSSELGLDLFRIDLSAVTSKWVGETEKHLARIFDEAQSANAMLLFDEADSLFGKRTELRSAQDRYANLEVNYVLQRMEHFDGVSILTTNFESAIDPAFLRRLNFRVRFPAPEVEERELLWRQLLPPETGLADEVDFAALAERFVMTGGYIRNAIVRAAVIAAHAGRAMSAQDLLTGAHQEYVELGKVMPSLTD